MNIEIIEYDIYRDYDPYSPNVYITSFKTLDEAVEYCEKQNLNSYGFHIVLDYKVN